METLRKNWAILACLLGIACGVGRLMAQVDQLRQDVQNIKSRLGLADSSGYHPEDVFDRQSQHEAQQRPPAQGRASAANDDSTPAKQGTGSPATSGGQPGNHPGGSATMADPHGRGPNPSRTDGATIKARDSPSQSRGLTPNLQADSVVYVQFALSPKSDNRRSVRTQEKSLQDGNPEGLKRQAATVIAPGMARSVRV